MLERKLGRGGAFMLGCMVASIVMLASSSVALGEGESASVQPMRSALESYLMGNVKIKGENRAQMDAQRRMVDAELSLQDKIIAKAKHLGLTKGKEYEAMVELAKRQIIVRRYWDYYFRKHPISDAAVKKLYWTTRDADGNHQYRVSEILVKNNAQVNKALDALGKHESFSDVARKYSISATRSLGGDLGWQWKSHFIPQVAQAVGYLKTGQYTSVPISLPSGLLIIRLDATRKRDFPTLDQLKQKLESALRLEEQKRVLARLARAKN